MSIGTATATVTVMVGAVAGIVAWLLIADGYRWPRVIIALVTVASAGLITGTVGTYVHQGITAFDNVANRAASTWFGPGFVVSVVIGVLVVGMLILRIKNNHVDTRTLGLAAAAPFAVTMIPGMAGAALATVFGFVAGVVIDIVQFFFHVAG